MLEWILAAIGVAGFGFAGFLDLKTTEFPDWLPYSMIVSALVARGVFSFLGSNWSILADSLIVGAIFLGLGLGMYFLKQWGDGDAWLLGALGFLFPNASGFPYAGALPFPVAIVFNFLLGAFVYIIAYSFILSLAKPEVYHGFARSFRSKYKGTILLVGGLSAAYFMFLIATFLLFGLVPPSPLFAAAFPVFIAFIAVFSHYGVYIEKNLFKKRIPVGKLRAGDVPVGGKWRVLKPSEVRALKKRGGYIWIKEGVRFAPVFLIALLLTLIFGDLFSLIFRIV
jgi:Flp pilus assembly protein protease CpaA